MNLFLRTKWGVTIVLVALSVTACQRTVYEVDRQPVSRYSNAAMSMEAIEDSIVRAAKQERWTIKKEGPGRMEATKPFKRRLAAVTILYDRESFSIKYKPTLTWRTSEVRDDTTGATQTVIHRRYNGFVKRLHKEIIRQIKLGPSQSTARPEVPRTANISRGNERLVSTGTGFYVSRDGDLVTNHHVVGACYSYKVRSVTGGHYDARLVASDKVSDLAILRTEHKPDFVANLRSGNAIRLGEDVTVFGFPLSGILSDQGIVTKGNISALHGIGGDSTAVQISAAVQKGNSGGPLLDNGGKVVGVVYSKLNAIKVAKYTGDIPQNVNFAIKRFTLANFLSTHTVAYETDGGKAVMHTADVVDLAKKYTVRVEC